MSDEMQNEPITPAGAPVEPTVTPAPAVEETVPHTDAPAV